MSPKISEEKTKGLTADKLKTINGYPTSQNVCVDGITWFKEDSYKGTSYDWIKDVFKNASKKQTMSSKGTPDFTVVKDAADTIVIIECKGPLEDHSRFPNVNEYITDGYGGPSETTKYAIDGALWYASFLSDSYDVIAVSVSGDESSSRVTSFVWPKGEDISKIALIEDGDLSNALVSLDEYAKNSDIVLGRNLETEEQVRRELRRYTLDCANFLRQNGIEDNSKAGFVSAVILGLTNKDSTLYKNTKAAIDRKKASKSKKMLTDNIGRSAVKQLKNSLYGEGTSKYDPDYIDGIWDIDGIPEGKRNSLKKFYNGLLAKSELTQAPKGKDKYFPDGDTVLSCCIYSLYENVIEVLESYTGIDIMGEFYTTFLRFTKGNAKEKGIVLTPKHITELFCDIAEFYCDKKFDENTKVIDICCGTGAFLISSLNRIKTNIYAEPISETEKVSRFAKAQKNSLVGVERDASMYALAYANMRFHGDGKSNLFNCSSLLIDSYAPVDESGKTFIEDRKVPLHEALSLYGDIDVGMINPPYSLDKKDSSSTQEYLIIKELNALKDKKKQQEKKLRDLKKKSASEKDIKKAEDLLANILSDLADKNQEFSDANMGEITMQKGQDELDFIASMLHYLKVGGIGIAIVPMSCAGNSGKKLRSELLKHHTLLACMTMPQQLFFDSHVGTATCIMVFKAHIPHDESKSVFFGRWLNDGFKIIPHNGRKDTGSWDDIRRQWIDQIDGTAPPDEFIWLRRKVKRDDEALAEAYLQTDYSKLTRKDFERTLMKYSLFKYMESNGLLEE